LIREYKEKERGGWEEYREKEKKEGGLNT